MTCSKLARSSFLLIALSLVSISSFAGPFDRYVQQQINKRIPEASVGIQIINAKTGKTIYQRNQDHAFEPASNTKIFTAAAALKLLGTNFHFETGLYLNPKQISKGTLNGNVYLKFSGDPSLTTRQFNRLLNTLKTKKIRRINGNIVLDTNAYQGATYPLGMMHDDLSYCFAAPVDSIILNQNCMHISVDLNSKNQKVIKRSSDAKGFKIIENLKYMPGRKEPKTCIFDPRVNAQNQVSLNGCLLARKNWNFSIAVANPTHYAKRLIQEFLNKKGIRLNGSIKTGTMPRTKFKLLKQQQSSSLTALVDTMLTYSNNVYAESFTKMVGKRYYGVGSSKAGVNAIEAITAKMTGRSFKHLTIEDGAGASRYNLITPREITRVLRAVYRDPAVKNAFIKGLPQSGISGTLSYRMNKKPYLGRVFAKTGSMRGVSTLSGFVKNKKGQTLIFSIMVNGLTQPLRGARNFQNKIVEKAYQTLS